MADGWYRAVKQCVETWIGEEGRVERDGSGRMSCRGSRRSSLNEEMGGRWKLCGLGAGICPAGT